MYNIINTRFIVDAQLPQRLSHFLVSKGYDSIHTLDMPSKNETTDTYIKNLSIADNRVLITKDDDFLHSYLIEKKPSKLILVKTGNINNDTLIDIFEKEILNIIEILKCSSMIEITKNTIVIHG